MTREVASERARKGGRGLSWTEIAQILKEKAVGVLGVVGRILQCAKSSSREVRHNFVLRSIGGRIKAGIGIVGWQKQPSQHEIGLDLMQRERGTLAERCFAEKEVP